MKHASRHVATLGAAVLLAVAGLSLVSVQRARTADNPSAQERLQALEDKAAIREVILAYGRDLDARDWEAFSNLFAEEGEWIGGMGKGHGRAMIKKMMEDTIGSSPGGKIAATGGQSNFHVFTNISIDVHGDTATGVTKWMFVVNADNKPQPLYLGHYNDDFVRENGAWKFLRRTTYGDIPAAEPNMTVWQPKADQ